MKQNEMRVEIIYVVLKCLIVLEGCITYDIFWLRM